MKSPEIPGTLMADVLRLARPIFTVLPRAHEADFGEDAIAASRNAEMVRDMQREKDIIAAHEGMRRMALQLNDERARELDRARNMQQLAAMQQMAMQAQQQREHDAARRVIGSYRGVDFIADECLPPGKIYELIRERRNVGPFPRPAAEREPVMMAHAEKMAHDLRRALTLEEVNKLRELYRLEPWSHEPDNRTGYFIPGSTGGNYRLD